MLKVWKGKRPAGVAPRARADGGASELLVNPEFITSRSDLVNSRNCKPELQPYLPKDIYEELERTDFETLRETLTQLFSEWL
jgi:hypothetical protein